MVWEDIVNGLRRIVHVDFLALGSRAISIWERKNLGTEGAVDWTRYRTGILRSDTLVEFLSKVTCISLCAKKANNFEWFGQTGRDAQK